MKAKVIGFINRKGGVGKTTLSICVATALTMGEQKYRVLLIDADTQRSAMKWVNRRETDPLFPVVGLPTEMIHREVKHHLPNYDYIIIDGPGEIGAITRSIVLASDVLLIPMGPSPVDIEATEDVLSLLEQAKPFKEAMDQEIRVAFVVAKKDSRTALGRDIVEALSVYQQPVEPRTIPVGTLNTHICTRVVHAESAATGQSPLEVEPTGKAAAEVIALTIEILKFTDGQSL